MQLMDGKKIAGRILEDLRREIGHLGKQLRLAIVVVGADPAVSAFIEQKKKAAKEVGIDTRVYPFEETITTNELRKRIADITHERINSGVIIQLPLPAHINRQYILNSVTPEKDVDVLSARAIGNFAVGKHLVMPPVVGAVELLLRVYDVDYGTKRIVVLGAGNLVGKPIAMWLLHLGATFSVIRSSTDRPTAYTREADIIITGIGKPGYVTAEMIKEGVVLVDAGTSESDGKMVGDVDAKSVEKKVALLSPVPGGVGPVAVAMVLKNLVTLAARKQ